jgi:hypothetical protein
MTLSVARMTRVNIGVFEASLSPNDARQGAATRAIAQIAWMERR